MINTVDNVNAVAPSIQLVPNEISIADMQVNSDLKINITVENVDEIFQWETELYWDPDVLNLTAISEGPFLKTAGDTFFVYPSLTRPDYRGNLPNMVDSINSFGKNASGSGVIATLTFKILSIAPTEITMNGTGLYQYNPTYTDRIALEHTSTGASLTVNQPTPTPSATPEVTPTSTPVTTTPPASSTPTPTASLSSSPTPTPTDTSQPDSTIIYIILIAGAAIAAIIATAVMLQRR
ncbi:MAG: cohesin domain-containing protein [Candidatus Bathyarchaeia archaeon]